MKFYHYAYGAVLTIGFCISVFACEMQDDAREKLLKRIAALNEKYFEEPHSANNGQDGFVSPGEPFIYLTAIEDEVRLYNCKNLSSLFLKIAADDNCNELLEALLDAGISADCQKQSENGKIITALGQAINNYGPNPKFKNAKLLLTRGAKPQVPSKIQSFGDPEKVPAVALLLSHGAKLEDVCVQGLPICGSMPNW